MVSMDDETMEAIVAVSKAIGKAAEKAKLAEQDRLAAIIRNYAESKPESHPGILCVLEIQELYADSCRRAQSAQKDGDEAS